MWKQLPEHCLSRTNDCPVLAADQIACVQAHKEEREKDSGTSMMSWKAPRKGADGSEGPLILFPTVKRGREDFKR